MFLAAFYLCWPWRDHKLLPKPDLIFVDQISAPIPFLKLLDYKIVFYCHFPDLLLSQSGSALKRVYRVPLDFMEEWSTGKADKILVNSHFTEGVFRETFTRLKNTPVEVLYPTLAIDVFDASPDESKRIPGLESGASFFLSLNRYERKKRVDLAIKALDKLRDLVTTAVFAGTRLIVAGGYDSRVAENIEHHEELVKLAAERGLTEKIIFLKSPGGEISPV